MLLLFFSHSIILFSRISSIRGPYLSCLVHFLFFRCVTTVSSSSFPALLVSAVGAEEGRPPPPAVAAAAAVVAAAAPLNGRLFFSTGLDACNGYVVAYYNYSASSII